MGLGAGKFPRRGWGQRGGRGTYVVVYPQFFGDHAFAHVEALEEDCSGCQRQLREFEEYPGLYDEVDALRPEVALLWGSKTIYDRGRTEDLLLCEKPLT